VLLINVCCAVCALPILDFALDKPDFLFFCPNIYPAAEYQKRLAEVGKIAALYRLKLVEGEYNHADWLDFITAKLSRPPQEYGENSERCRACFEYRLEYTAKTAVENNYSHFASTLSPSRFKDTAFIDQYGNDLAKRKGLVYVDFSLDPHQAHQKGLALSKEYGIYRQKYCGCEFSLPKGSLPVS